MSKLITISPHNIKSGMLCHIDGWNPAAVFKVITVKENTVDIMTPKTRKIYFDIAKSKLKYTRKNEPLETKDV